MIKKTVLSVTVIIVSISVLWMYIWQNEAILSINLIVALCVLVAAHIALHFIKCRKWIAILFSAILNAISSLFSLYVLELFPALIVIMIGIFIYSTFYVYWILKENGKAVLSNLIAYWIAVIILFMVIINGLALYRHLVAEGERHRRYSEVSAEDSSYLYLQD